MQKNKLQISVLKWLQGDVNAFSLVYDYYIDRIYRFIYFKAPASEAEDLTEEVFLKVMQKKDTFDPQKSAFSTWIYTIARNTVVDFLRSNKPVLELHEYVADTKESSHTAYKAEKSLQEENLKKALATLPKNKQDIVILRFIDELSYEEIAEILGKSAGSVRITMMRTLRDLRKVLEKLET